VKKFSDITKKDEFIDFKKNINQKLSTDVINLNTQIFDEISGTKLDGEWEIVNIIDVSIDKPANEAIIINAELGGKDVKRGDFLYVTALINKKGAAYHQSQMGVLKVRIVEIYNSLLVLNSLK
jgi:hypothetical protein